MPSFLVRNNRPRRPLDLEGRVLRASRPSKGVEAGEIWIDVETFQGAQVTKLLRLRRLVVADCRDTTMEEVQDYLDNVIFADVEDAPAVEAPAEAVDEGTDSEDEPVVVEDPPEVVEPVVDEPVEVVPVVDEPVEVDEATELVQEGPMALDTIYPLDELLGLHYRKELQPLAKDLGLSASGTKDDIAQRIFDHQKGVS